MNIVLLGAGTSSRMGRTNKMLLQTNSTTMIANSTMQALKYLASLNESSTLIVVTGYRRYSIEKALKECKDFVLNTQSPLSMIIAYNKDYKKGQFSSVQTGVKQVADNSPFFISLADMPKITFEHYSKLQNKLGNFDAVRVMCNNVPGHPVLFSASMKKKILSAHCNNKVSSILKKCNVRYIEENNPSWITDVDTPEDYKCLN